jgi:hypothetical protein
MECAVGASLSSGVNTVFREVWTELETHVNLSSKYLSYKQFKRFFSGR